MKSDTWERQAVAAEAAPTPKWSLVQERLTAATWWIVGTVEIVLGLRILLRAIGANPENPFAGLVYRATAGMLEPFVGLTRNPELDGMVLEIHAMIALLVVALAGWVIARGLELVAPPGFPEA
jgi:hypothetical protein